MPRPVAPSFVATLDGGHRIVATPGSVVSFTDRGSQVEVRLTAGEALFDVAPLGEGGSFVVHAGGVDVAVHGTVFTVSRELSDVRVAVFEGEVAVTGARRVLHAGDAWSSLDDSASPVEPRLADRARRAAARRAERRAARATAATSMPAPPSAPAPPPAAPAPPARAARDAPSGMASPSSREPPLTPDAARALVAAQRYEEALVASDRALGERPSFEWRSLRADALRGLGRDEEAAAELARAVDEGDPRERAIAGLGAARILARRLGREADARAILERSGSLDAASPVREAAARFAAELATPER